MIKTYYFCYDLYDYEDQCDKSGSVILCAKTEIEAKEKFYNYFKKFKLKPILISMQVFPEEAFFVGIPYAFSEKLT